MLLTLVLDMLWVMILYFTIYITVVFGFPGVPVSCISILYINPGVLAIKVGFCPSLRTSSC